ncbi:hypothetical protein JHD50_07675 [Sulfurimonas sp. MAG313]|nr:hypothetical protein [Sulfurimonas sp. MAG313]MDF1881181.1 hypothetical protein [Sulfurimonas sp. MAG313]
MIKVTTPQKDIILSYFKDDLTLIAKYEKLMKGPAEKNFKYLVFKEFIFSAAGMIREIDHDLYNKNLATPFKVIKTLDLSYISFKGKNKHVISVYKTEFLQWQDDYVIQKKRYDDLKSEIQMLIVSEATLGGQLKEANKKIAAFSKKKEDEEAFKELDEKTKKVRSDHVDSIHFLGERRKELSNLLELLSNFEEEHKKLFVDFFNQIKAVIDTRYIKALNYFGFKFNTKLFHEASTSPEILAFKRRANIHGDFCLCKYVEYYLKNVSSDAIADTQKRQNLEEAKRYCKNERERENLI